jgi:hypothetical protein
MNYYFAYIENRTVSRKRGESVGSRFCGHHHNTRQEAERCSYELWRKAFGKNFDDIAVHNPNYRPRTQEVKDDETD